MSRTAIPNFLGIGSVRGGSTWLHSVLQSHPDFCMSERKKEVMYFTKFYAKGHDWYRAHFEERGERWVGEFTPGYLANADPARIKAYPSIHKLVVILRDPVERCISHYKWHLRATGAQMSFAYFQEKLPKLALENGYYAKHLRRYLPYFGKEDILLLVYEDAVHDMQKTARQLGDFFGVDPEGFQEPGRVNQSLKPKNSWLFHRAYLINAWMIRNDLDKIAHWIKHRLGLKKRMMSEDSFDIAISMTEKQALRAHYAADVAQLKEDFDLDLSSWEHDE